MKTATHLWKSWALGYPGLEHTHWEGTFQRVHLVSCMQTLEIKSMFFSKGDVIKEPFKLIDFLVNSYLWCSESSMFVETFPRRGFTEGEKKALFFPLAVWSLQMIQWWGVLSSRVDGSAYKVLKFTARLSVNNQTLNTTKTKEINLDFRKHRADINGDHVERVHTFSNCWAPWFLPTTFGM